jgi:hypothetical protein
MSSKENDQEFEAVVSNALVDKLGNIFLVISGQNGVLMLHHLPLEHSNVAQKASYLLRLTLKLKTSKETC